ncbi:myc-associated zinc finger protein-like isoform X1 [Polypterus senegalus]|uniref:myc-associated zinc finger protein-like isoform X1 n=1 Tax=Polypterus senegalus TaxID=55291 RepID=UPI0019665835|nr:myc-associated zinc finger protein-like isoform X1 [Polypterus senegalus]
MDAAWSNFLFQTQPTQAQATDSLQVELLPVLEAPPPPPPATSITPITPSPPSTVDTAALSQETDSGVDASSVNRGQKRPRAVVSHICSTCSKQFKNGYNLRRHQAVHTGIKREQRELPRVPVSLLELPGSDVTAALPITVTQQPAGSISTETVTANAQPILGAAVLASAVQTPESSNARRVRKNHACEACGKAFRDVYHLNRHKLSHSDEKPFECPICQQRFKRKDRMSYHVRSHQGGVEKPYVCPHCAKGFSRPDHLNSHVRQVHSTERPFKCQTCESAFATKDRLRAHMIRHEEKVPCHVCGKLLSAAYITDHMRVHNQSQNHVCETCNRGFTTLAYLRVHAQKHHGLSWRPAGGAGGTLVCQLCGVHCKTASQLSGHMGTHNNRQNAEGGTPQGTGDANLTASS